jgi:hypothetical protein
MLAIVAAPAAGATPVPKHPPLRHSHPASAAQSAPDMTGSVRPPQSAAMGGAAGEPPATAPAPVDVLTPFYLPDVSRRRMHACGEAWRERKLAGEAGDDTWRDFATRCLADGTATAGR